MDGPRGAAPRPTLRLFFGLWPDDAVRGRLAPLAREVAARALGKPAPAENLHMTLAFLGDVPADRVDALVAIGESLPRDAFTITLDTLGGFRGSGIAWVGASEVPAPLRALNRALADALGRGRYRVDERPFRPHVTLARRCVRRVTGAMPAPIEWPVTRMALNASSLGPDRSRYRDVAAWTLR